VERSGTSGKTLNFCQPIKSAEYNTLESASTTDVVIQIVVLVDLKKLQISILPEF
jgi:hypothetical protein